MGKASRDKGKRGEQEVAILLREAWPWLDPHRAIQARKGDDYPDIDGTPFYVEVKRTKGPLAMPKVMAKLEAEADHRPPVIFARCDSGQWLVTMRASDWVALAGHVAIRHGDDPGFEGRPSRRILGRGEE